jgi:hypothetical protein
MTNIIPYDTIAMEVHILNINLDKINPALLKAYFLNKREITLLFSETSILEIHKSGEIQKRMVEDDSVATFVKVWIYELLINRAKQKTEICYQVPVNHIEVKTTQYTYQLNKKSPIKLVIEYENNKITNLFFKTPLLNNIDEIKNDVVSLLSLLN